MITAAQLSKYRQDIRRLVSRIEHLSSRCQFADPLIRGTPAEVFRKCGRSNCKCASDENQRHGPYKVIQIKVDKKQKQFCLRQDEGNLWELAKRYQHQIEKWMELRDACSQLQTLVGEVIEKREQELPKR